MLGKPWDPEDDPRRKKLNLYYLIMTEISTPSADSSVQNNVISTDKPATTPAIKKKTKKIKKIVTIGNIYINASYNNTIITFTDQKGDVISSSSAGQAGFSGPKKATPYAAGIIVRRAAEKAKERGLRDVNIFVSGIGSGREASIRAINANGFNVLTVKDITPIPHNGCRSKKPRRV